MKFSTIVRSSTEDLIKSANLTNKNELLAVIGTVANNLESLLNPAVTFEYDEITKLTTLYAALKAVYDHRYSK